LSALPRVVRPLRPPPDPEPGAADAEDLVLAAGLVVDPGLLLPEADHHAGLLVHHGGHVVVVPAVEAGHLGAQRIGADLLTAHGHEVLVGGVHPPVRRVLGVVVGQRTPVPGLLRPTVGVLPAPPELLQLISAGRTHLSPPRSSEPSPG